MSYLDFFSGTSPLVAPKETKGHIMTVFGVPFDSTTSYRPGARFGPNAIREAFLNVEAYSKALDVDVEKVPIRDLGNLAVNRDPKGTIEMVSKVAQELFKEGERFCMLGGEHSITLGSVRNAPKDSGLVVFDAHFDLRNEWEGSIYSHACYLRRVLEKRNPKSVVHIGGRAATKEEWDLSKKLGFVVEPQAAESPASVKRFQKFLSSFESVYVTLDIDALDPAYAPGTGTPEPGGLTTSTLLGYIYALRRTKIVAFDIVEMSPPYDNGATSTAAARFMNELVGIVAKQTQ